MKRLTYLFAVLIAATTLIACDDDYNAPQTTRAEFQTQYPNAVDVEWEKKRGYVVAEFHIPGQGECEAWYTKGGEWVMTKYDIKFSDLPAAVQTAFVSEYGAQTPVDDVERLERRGNDTLYFIEAEIVINGYLTDIDLDYAEDGTLLRTTVDVEDYDNVYYYI
ncbi:MAG: PepSY-like domain-containing protein [Alistipes sp.]|nr:PepSY-like domain-containing protein [Alistipes sp.]